MTVLTDESIGAIEAEICLNVKQLFNLGKSHLLFAQRQTNKDWRQKVSRLYYAAYNMSRAVRLCVQGEYSTDSSDHKKIEATPDDFPNKNSYDNRLGALRDDRNLCDYDHASIRGDLVSTPDESLQLVEEFAQDARKYLRARGIQL